MKHTNHHVVKPLVAVLAAVLATGAVVNTAVAETKGTSETININEYSDWGNPGMAKIAVDSGRALIEHLTTARALLDTGQVSEARSALTASREFADAIARTMPYLTVVDDIRNASHKLVEEDVTTVPDNLLPIYASLDELQLYAPQVANRTRGMVQKAEKNAAAGKKKEAAVTLKEAADDIALHTVYLPVYYVDEQVHGALYALDKTKPDVTVAKAAVNRALDSVTSVVDEVVGTAN